MPAPYQTFPPSLLILSPRVTRTGDASSSIAGLNTTPLADGIVVFCIENKSEYQLDRDSVAAADGVLVIQPSAGPGRWLIGSGGSGAGGVLVFANPAAVAAFDATSTANLALASVGVVDDSYRYLVAPPAALLAAADGVNVIAPAAPAGAVFVRLYERNLSAQYVTAWFLDPAGSDANDGLTSVTALKTMHELAARLYRGKLSADVTVTLAAGSYATDPVQFDLEIPGGVSLLMKGNVSSVGDTLFAVLPTVPGTAATNAAAQRGTVTATAGTFTDRQRLRMTSSVGTAIDSMAYVTKVVTPGAGGVANVSRWGKLSNPRTSTVVSNNTPAAADTYALDTLNSQIGFFDIRVRGAGRFVVQDCLVRPTSSTSTTHRAASDNGNLNGVLAYGCIFQHASATIFDTGTWTMAVCSVSSDIGTIVFNSSENVFCRMCTFTGTAAVPAFTIDLFGGAYVSQSEGCCIDGGNFIVSGVWDQIGANNNDIQFVDGSTSHAVEVTQAGLWWAHSGTNQQWGLNNAYSGVTYLIDAGGRYNYNGKPSVPGGTGSDFNVGGTTGAYAALPVFKTAAGAGAGAIMSN